MNETSIRGGIFLVLLLVMMLWEWQKPRRTRALPRTLRWFSNLGLSALNRVLILLMALLGISVAGATAQADWGLFNWLAAPAWVAILGSILLLDLVVYFQHRLLHAVPLFWRLHRMHHTDIDFDATTGVRFHPLEAMLSMGIKLTAILCLGAPVIAVVVFEVILNATSLFNHSNVKIPLSIDRILRWWLVTPDMHRVHHSVRLEELNSNFGFNLPWWDRLFSTYKDQPVDGHEGMSIGLNEFRAPAEARLDRLLLQPFS